MTQYEKAVEKNPSVLFIYQKNLYKYHDSKD